MLGTDKHGTQAVDCHPNRLNNIIMVDTYFLFRWISCAAVFLGFQLNSDPQFQSKKLTVCTINHSKWGGGNYAHYSYIAGGGDNYAQVIATHTLRQGQLYKPNITYVF